VADWTVIPTAAVTTGLFVLAGVVTGGLLTGAVNYALERRRDRANARVAVRLLWAELLLAAASVDWRLEQDVWSPWSFESAHRAWNEHQAELARAVSMADFADVTLGFAAVGRAEATFAHKPVAEGSMPMIGRRLTTHRRASTTPRARFRDVRG
jgi:hypothetical protein